MKAGRVALIVIGSIFILTSIGLLIGGSVITAIDKTWKDQDGYYSTNKMELSADSAAIVTGPADFEIDSTWICPDNWATVKIEATSVEPGEAIFIGIARTSKLNDYLEGVSYSEPRDYSEYHHDIVMRTYRGADSAPAPTTQDFWIASASGSGTQTLEWEIDSGRYSVVLMNADGSAPVDADVSLGIKIPELLSALGVGFLVSGFILLAGGGVMLFFGIRGW